MDGPWFWSWLARATPEMRANLEMVRLPFDPQLAPGGLTLSLSDGLSPEKKAAAWKFVAFATRPEYQRSFIVTTGQPSGRVSPVLTPADEKDYPHLVTVSASARDAEALFPADQAIRANFAEFSAIIMKAALRAISTQDPVPTILAEAQAELERAIPLK